jgi:hypothetical protein
MNDSTTEIQQMIQKLNQYILPGTLMESFDAYREEAYRQAVSSIPKTTVAWFLDMLNRFRGPEDRKESLLKVFDPSMFTVNHPAWETPPGTVIDLPALTSEVAANAKKDSEMAEISREEIRRFREHADTYYDEELMQLGSIAIAGLADQGRTFQNREAVLHYLALNASTGMEDLWAGDDTDWLEAPTRHIEFPDMVARRREQLLSGEGPANLRERDFACYSDDEVRAFALNMWNLFLHDRARHLVICSRCRSRLGSWTKLLRDFDKNTILQQRRPDA